MAARPATIPPSDRLAVSVAEASALLSMSIDSFEKFVQPEIKMVRRGRLRLVPRRELERWLECSSSIQLKCDS